MNNDSKSIETPAMEKPAQPGARKPPSWLPAAVLLVVFLLGFAPMWLKSSRLNGELSRARGQARAQQIQITLADASLDARRGDYEPARQKMVIFYALVNAELDRGAGSALPNEASEGLKSVLAQRDNLITLLARGDPASAERLAATYAGFRKTIVK